MEINKNVSYIHCIMQQRTLTSNRRHRKFTEQLNWYVNITIHTFKYRFYLQQKIILEHCSLFSLNFVQYWLYLNKSQLILTVNINLTSGCYILRRNIFPLYFLYSLFKTSVSVLLAFNCRCFDSKTIFTLQYHFIAKYFTVKTIFNKH